MDCSADDIRQKRVLMSDARRMSKESQKNVKRTSKERQKNATDVNEQDEAKKNEFGVHKMPPRPYIMERHIAEHFLISICHKTQNKTFLSLLFCNKVYISFHCSTASRSRYTTSVQIESFGTV